MPAQVAASPRSRLGTLGTTKVPETPEIAWCFDLTAYPDQLALRTVPPENGRTSPG